MPLVGKSKIRTAPIKNALFGVLAKKRPKLLAGNGKGPKVAKGPLTPKQPLLPPSAEAYASAKAALAAAAENAAKAGGVVGTGVTAPPKPPPARKRPRGSVETTLPPEPPEPVTAPRPGKSKGKKGKAKDHQPRPIGPGRLGASGYWNQEVGTGIHVYQNRLTPLEVLTQNVLAYVFTCTNEICPMLFQEYPSVGGGVALR